MMAEFDEIRELAKKTKLDEFLEGMSNGTIMTMELTLGVNKSKLLPDDVFEELRYKGERPADLTKWLQEALEKGYAERAERTGR